MSQGPFVPVKMNMEINSHHLHNKSAPSSSYQQPHQHREWRAACDAMEEGAKYSYGSPLKHAKPSILKNKGNPDCVDASPLFSKAHQSSEASPWRVVRVKKKDASLPATPNLLGDDGNESSHDPAAPPLSDAAAPSPRAQRRSTWVGGQTYGGAAPPSSSAATEKTQPAESKSKPAAPHPPKSPGRYARRMTASTVTSTPETGAKKSFSAASPSPNGQRRQSMGGNTSYVNVDSTPIFEQSPPASAGGSKPAPWRVVRVKRVPKEQTDNAEQSPTRKQEEEEKKELSPRVIKARAMPGERRKSMGTTGLSGSSTKDYAAGVDASPLLSSTPQGSAPWRVVRVKKSPPKSAETAATKTTTQLLPDCPNLLGDEDEVKPIAPKPSPRTMRRKSTGAALLSSNHKAPPSMLSSTHTTTASNYSAAPPSHTVLPTTSGIQARLRPTQRGSVIKSGVDIASPITNIPKRSVVPFVVKKIPASGASPVEDKRRDIV